MMDLERTKKINSMIPELKKQGFAKNSTEAALQSDALFRNPGEESVITQTKSAPIPEQQAQEPATPPLSVAGPNPEVVSHLTALEQKVTNLEQDISSIISKMNEMISVITKLEQRGAQTPAASPRETQKTIAPKKEEGKKEPHARSGNYTPQDVDINKIFYYGNK